MLKALSKKSKEGMSIEMSEIVGFTDGVCAEEEEEDEDCDDEPVPTVTLTDLLYEPHFTVSVAVPFATALIVN